MAKHKPMLTFPPELEAEIRDMHRRNYTNAEISRELGRSDSLISKWLKRLGLTSNFQSGYSPATVTALKNAKPRLLERRHEKIKKGRYARRYEQAKKAAAKKAAAYEPPALLPEYAMNVKRAKPPRGCCHVEHVPTDWQAVHYCNRPRAGRYFCLDHASVLLVPVAE